MLFCCFYWFRKALTSTLWHEKALQWVFGDEKNQVTAHLLILEDRMAHKHKV